MANIVYNMRRLVQINQMKPASAGKQPRRAKPPGRKDPTQTAIRPRTGQLASARHKNGLIEVLIMGLEKQSS
ncbi:hypothetical protein GCM10011316_36640 [Roseibium aquae]|uniref:Uncharacterized protein n=1 Tax=Roseibium aquae TaxID=1323746 RepID=A0A916TMW2_9HYPH|nr:hypothetical protein GCM10011316_36640 [Roseibium aquae]